jgi:ribosomal biogenesis protein LAS1
VKESNQYAAILELTQTASYIPQALSWLGKNYFLPTLAKNAPQAPDSTPPLAPLLKQYKTLMKSILRDRSIQRSMGGNLDMALRSFDAWIGQAATAAWSLWDSDAAERGAWALEKLSLALTQSGGLVPVAKKYAGFNKFLCLHSLSRPKKTAG